MERCMDVIVEETDKINAAQNEISSSMAMIKDRLFDIIDIIENDEELDEEEKKNAVDKANAVVDSIEADGELGLGYVGDTLDVLFEFVNE